MTKATPRTPQARRPRRRTCEYCDTPGEDVEKSGGWTLCGNCESEYFVYCSVCVGVHLRDDECRHLTWTDCGFTGAGATDGLDPERMHKEGVFLFFDLLDTLTDDDGDNLARSAAREIGRDRFFIRMYGTTLSADGIDLVRMRFDLHPTTKWLGFGEVRREDTEGFDHGTLSDGFGWLATLDEAATKAANRLTLKWYRQWKAERDAGRRPLPEGRTRTPDLARLPKRAERPQKKATKKAAKKSATKSRR